MTCCSDDLVKAHTEEVVLASLDRCSFVDNREGFRVVLLNCFFCGKSFLEGLGSAKRKVVDGLVLLCLSCDPDADVRALKCVAARQKRGGGE